MSASNPQNLKQLVDNIERDLLYQIIFNLKQNELSVEGAKKLARDFLSILPIQSQEDLYNKLSSLSQKYHEIQPLFLKYSVPFKKQKEEQAINLMKQHIEQGNPEKAIDVAKGGI